MIKITHKVKISKSPKKVYNFFLNLNTKKYKKWYKGHLKYKILEKEKGIPSVVYMEEMIGKRKVKLRAYLSKHKKNRLFVFRARHGSEKGSLSLEFRPDKKGTIVIHTLAMRFPKFLEWFFRTFGILDKFKRELGQHVSGEFKALEKVIR